MKIVFAGTPEFAAVALDALIDAGHEIVLVLTQPDRPAGRRLQLHASAVKQRAIRYEIPVSQPVSLKLAGKYPAEATAARELLNATPHDVMVVAAYGLILPEWVLGIPPLGCVNIHASLLPRWRGAAPIHRAIEAGDPETGIAIMQMDRGLDTGAIFSMRAIPIAARDNTATLHDKLAQLGGEMVVEVLARLPTGEITPMPQSEQGVIYAAKISKEESLLDFNLSAQLLERKIRALNPTPGAHCTLNGETFKIWDAEVVVNPPKAEVGQFMAEGSNLLVPCGEGALHLLELQKPGSKRLQVGEFLKGFVPKAPPN